MSARIRQWGHVLLLAAILAVGAWFSLRDLAFFSSDTGLRYLQARTIQEYGWRQIPVPYAGLPYDPGLRFVPYYYAYTPYGDHLLLAISPFFPVAVAGLLTLFGRPGLVILPVLGAVAAAAGVAGLGRLAGLNDWRRLFWGAVMATPLVFYSMTLWDHTVGVALSTAAVYFAARSLQGPLWLWPFGAGLLIALAVAQRADILPLTAALGVALAVVSRPRWRQPILYAAGGLAGLLATAPFNQIWVGHPLGIVIAAPYLGYNAAAYNPADIYARPPFTHVIAATRLLLDVRSGDMISLTAALLLVAGSILLTLVLRLPALRRASLLYLSALLVMMGTFLGMLLAVEPPVIGLFSTFPLLGLSLAYVDHEKGRAHIYQLVFIATWLFVALTLAVLDHDGGYQWGSRYLLGAVPLMYFLALYAYRAYRRRLPPETGRALGHVFAVLLLLSLVVQATGIAVLQFRKVGESRRVARIASLPADVILTDDLFLASHMVSLEDKVFLFAGHEAEILLLAQRLARQGVDRFAFIPMQPGEQISLPERAGPVRIVPEGPDLFRLEGRPDP